MNFDLNIDNYTKDELVSMFGLPNNFDKNIVEIQETKLKESILNNNEIQKDIMIKTINFLIKAKNIILDNSPTQNGSGTLQKNIAEFYNSSYDLKASQLEDNNEHMVQIRKDKPYLSSSPIEFFPGVINPLKKRTIKKNLNIDTKFRENYYTTQSTNFNFTLPVSMNDIIQMQLSAIELPTSYYVISKQYGNNFFSISVNGLKSVINIFDGNYNQNTILDAINSKLILLGHPFDKVEFIANVINNTGSGQTLVGEKISGSITSLELDFQADNYGEQDRNTPLPLKFGWCLGFRNGIYVNNMNYVSEGIIDTTGPRYLFLVVDDHNNNVNNGFYSAFNSSILNKNILSRISLQTNIFNILEQNNLNVIATPREYFGPVNIHSINIQLLDEYGRVVDLNNMDYSFCLNLTTVYDI